MRDLTEQLSTDISKAVNEFRNTVEDAQRLVEGAIVAAHQVLEGAIAAAHQVFEVASSLRLVEHNTAMSAQITDFLGHTKEKPDIPVGPISMAPAEEDLEEWKL